MAGQLVYLMGSSGAGKDTLLREVASRQRPNLVIAIRHITRAVTADEAHIAVSESEFQSNVDNHLYALHWRANGFAYGIESRINNQLAQGNIVIVNGSRAYLPTAKQRYPELVAVCLIVDVPTLRQRLIARNRDSTEEIDARLIRNETYQASLPQEALFINNNQPIADTCDDFLTKLKLNDSNRAARA